MAAAAVEQVDDAPNLKVPITDLLLEPACQFLIGQNELCVDKLAGHAEAGLTVIAGTAFHSGQHGLIQQLRGDHCFAQV
ncbi:hypothetical protein [Synechococcus sp. MIT S9509]|uniref:hypothetical protein n=1 Tax=Synechococcus sp. MIT S9509 TaxID=1801630 RepID=UPI0012E9351B|nr:hypothetical protein [Synechococcus sp. MIT S9509]